jgi:hypothetical protein
MPESLLGCPRVTHIRWLDATTDSFFLTYVGMVPATSKGFLASKIILLVQGHGARCSMDTSGAPRGQSGTFRLSDNRDAVWAVGRPDLGWATPGPVWVAWPGKDRRATVRIEAIGYDVGALRALTPELAAMES